jgi:hypothetical protein
MSIVSCGSNEQERPKPLRLMAQVYIKKLTFKKEKVQNQHQPLTLPNDKKATF